MSNENQKSTAPENEIRVSGKTNVMKCIERIEEVFKKFDNIVISGINSGISTVLLVTEIIKLKIPDLHQYNLIESLTREIHEEDNKEGESNETPKYLTRFKVELYRNKLASPPKGTFYEAPYSKEKIEELKSVNTSSDGKRPPFRGHGGRGRFRGRGGRGGRRDNDKEDNGEKGFRGNGRGRPRGRGRGPRGAPRGEGRGRGGPRGEGRGRGAPRGEGRGRGAQRGGKKEQGEKQ